MIISDLNYLEVATEVVEGGILCLLCPPPAPTNKNFVGSVSATANLTVNSNVTSNFTKTATVTSNVNVTGTTAQFAFSNEAFGSKSIVQVDYIGIANAGQYSSQEGVVVAAAL